MSTWGSGPAQRGLYDAFYVADSAAGRSQPSQFGYWLVMLGGECEDWRRLWEVPAP